MAGVHHHRRMRASWQTGTCAALLAVLALVPRSAAAQSDPYETFAGGAVRSLEQEFQGDLRMLGAFAGKKRLDRFDAGAPERASPWKLYGRLGPMHFHNEMQYGSPGMQLSLRRQGPGLGGRIYLGIHKTFD